ncbi:hypothetical protein Tco_1531402 [Tanacetum coccineum]
MILESVEHGPLIWPMVEENGVIRTKKYAKLSADEKIQADCDMKTTNIILHGLPTDIYSLVNHHRVAKYLWWLERFWYESSNNDARYFFDKAGKSFAIPVFSPGDDPIVCLNKAMAFLTVIASSRFPTTNNQLRSSSNPRNQATIQDGRVTVQQVQGRQGKNYSGTAYKNNATSSRGNTASGIARPKRPRNAAWYKEKAMLAEAQEAGQILDEEQLAFLADPGIPASQAQTVIPHNATFQTEDLVYFLIRTVMISRLPHAVSYEPNISQLWFWSVISEVPNSKTYLNDMDNQSVHTLQDFEQSPVLDFTNNEISSDSNIIPNSQYLQETQLETIQDTNLQAQQDPIILFVIEQMINNVNNWEKANKEQNNESITVELERYKEMVKTFEQRLNIDLSCREKMIDSQMDDIIREKLALKATLTHLEYLSRQESKSKVKESTAQILPMDRGRKDKDKHEDPSTRSDRGLKKRKTSKYAEPTTCQKKKDSTSGSSKGTKSQSKSSGKSVQSKELVFEVADSDMPQDQEGNLGDNEDEPRNETASRRDWFKKPTPPQEPTDPD